MSKWADYVIYKVRYNTEKTHINSVKYMEDNGGTTFTSDNEFARLDVIKHIKAGKSFITIFKKTSDTNWHQGKEVIIFPIDGIEYIKTENNITKRDNLENLPEY